MNLFIVTSLLSRFSVCSTLYSSSQPIQTPRFFYTTIRYSADLVLFPFPSVDDVTHNLLDPYFQYLILLSWSIEYPFSLLYLQFRQRCALSHVSKVTGRVILDPALPFYHGAQVFSRQRQTNRRGRCTTSRHIG